MSKIVGKLVNPAGAKEWRANWAVVMASLAGVGFATIHAYSIGVMIAPLEEEFKWTRAEITSGLLIMSFVIFPLAPVMGMAIDRFGPRRIALFGTCFYATALALLSQAGQSLWSWWFLWFLLALASLFVKPTVWIAAISSLFNASRGLALAVALSATGLISFAVPIITHFLVENYGWRMTYALWGMCAVVITLPLVYFFFSSAIDQQRSTTKSGAITEPPVVTGFTVREGLRSWAFYRLAACSFIMSAANVAIIINLVPILMSSGISGARAAAVAGILGIAQVVGRLSGGFLLDRFNARIVAGVTTLLPIATCLLLLIFGGSIPAAAFAVLILGLCAGAEMDVIAYLGGRFFGMRKFGTLFGSIAGLITFGVGVGPVLANYVYDVTKSYDLVLWSVIPLSMLTSFLFLALGPYPNFEEKQV